LLKHHFAEFIEVYVAAHLAGVREVEDELAKLLLPLAVMFSIAKRLQGFEPSPCRLKDAVKDLKV
jgi:hypothetical protein